MADLYESQRTTHTKDSLYMTELIQGTCSSHSQLSCCAEAICVAIVGSLNMNQYRTRQSHLVPMCIACSYLSRSLLCMHELVYIRTTRTSWKYATNVSRIRSDKRFDLRGRAKQRSPPWLIYMSHSTQHTTAIVATCRNRSQVSGIGHWWCERHTKHSTQGAYFESYHQANIHCQHMVLTVQRIMNAHFSLHSCRLGVGG